MTDKTNQLESLMNQYGDFLKKTEYLFLGDLQIAEDMAQETFISFYKNSHSYNHKSSHKTYLYRILINNFKMYIRKNKISYKENENVAITSFENELITKLHLSEQIRQLDQKSIEIITLYYFNEFTITEISDILNITKSNAKMRLLRARHKLEPKLPKEDFYEFEITWRIKGYSFWKQR